MKKITSHTPLFQLNTLMAGALLAVGGHAVAEVSLSGTMDQAYEDVRLYNHTGLTKLTRIEPTLSNYNQLKFSGSEQVDHGLKASFEISFKDVADDADKQARNYLSHIALSGGFGSIKVGQQWRPMFNAVAYSDPTQLVYVPGFVGTASGLSTEPLSNSITYNLPSLVPGLFVQLQKGFGESAGSSQGDSQGMNIIFTDGKKFFVAYAKNIEKMAASGTGADFMGSIVGVGAASQLSTLKPFFTIYSSTTGTERRKGDGFILSYDFGPAKVVYGTLSESVEGTVAKQDMEAVGIKVPVTHKINFGYIRSKSENTRGSGQLTGTNFTQSGQRMLVTYDFSKRTTAYFAKGSAKYDGPVPVVNREFKTSINAVGIKHTF